MRIVTFLLSCLMSLAGCDEKPATTTIHHERADGVDLVISKTSSQDGVARFRCYASRSGECHYVVHADTCTAATPGSHANCTRAVIDTFTVQAGNTHELHGLPADFRTCVAPEAATASAACGS